MVRFHKTLKSHAALAKSPTKRERTRFVEPSGETGNHCFMVIYAACRLEGLRDKYRLNYFALCARLYLKAIRYAFDEPTKAENCVTSVGKRKKEQMNQQQFDRFKTEMRQMIETRIERPIEQLNKRMTSVEKKVDALREQMDERFAHLSAAVVRRALGEAGGQAALHDGPARMDPKTRRPRCDPYR